MYGPQQDDDKKKALQLQAQAAQPVYGPRNPPAGGRPSPLKPAAKPTLAEGDLAQAAAELASKQQPTNGPSVRFGVPNRRAEQTDQTSLSAAEAGKANQWSGGVADRASGTAIAAVKANPDSLPPTAAGGEGAPANKPVTPLLLQQAAPEVRRGAYLKTGVGQGAAGGEIVGRVGADGVPEFTNDAKAVAGAQAMPKGGFGYQGRATAAPGNMTAPAGARVLASGTNVPAGDAELARTGSAANVGNGIGTFSVLGETGDAQRAIASFERANQIRAEMIKESRRGVIGEGGGRVTVVRDSSRSPSITELINERRDLRLREADRADRLAGSRITTAGRATDRADQKQALDMAKGDVELAAAESALATSQELEGIRQQLADPSLDQDQRAALEATYYAMTGQSKDRYITVKGGKGEFGEEQPSRLFDTWSQKYVDGGVDGGAPKTAPAVGTVQGGYRFKGGNPADQNNWEKV